MRRAGGCDIRAVLLRWVVYWRCYHGVQMPDTIHVLVVDADPNVRSLLVAVLSRSPFTVVDAGSGGEAMAHLAREEFDVALVDVQLPDHSGLDILRWARDADVDAELIVLTGHADVETAVEAMRLGAYDFITKPWKNPELLEVVAKAAEKKALRRENSALREVIHRRDGLPTIIGDSPAVAEVLSVIGRVAATDSPVLIHGESGTGKELVARTIHLRCKRAGRPFVSINCSALPDTRLETELFGHRKGAFSGAVTSRVGLFEAANGGTLFMDEIGEMSAAMQVRLLRALDSGEVRRVGEERAFHVDVRIVAATAKDLTREATEGRFRSDLFYRVSTVVVEVPALRQRREDVPLLVQHFLSANVGARKPLSFATDALERLMAYDWPGNIRELRNLVERLQILHEGADVHAADLPPELSRSRPAAAVEGEADPVLVPLADVRCRSLAPQHRPGEPDRGAGTTQAGDARGADGASRLRRAAHRGLDLLAGRRRRHAGGPCRRGTGARDGGGLGTRARVGRDSGVSTGSVVRPGTDGRLPTGHGAHGRAGAGVRNSVATATLAVSSNVYYLLPAPTPVAEAKPALSRWANLS